MQGARLSWEIIEQEAKAIGFDDVGMVSAQRWDEDAAYMEHWVEQGLHGNMDYFERNRDKRYDIRQLVPGAKTVVVVLLTYTHSGKDYHRTIKSMLYRLQQLLTDHYATLPTASIPLVSTDYQHIFCDSAPVLERRMAVAAGLGFIGKNRQLIHPRLGSRVHIGELVLNVEVQDARCEMQSDANEGCGACRRCIEACPGKALGHDEWDARRCVAYVTHKCEICQQVCPYNENHS